LTENEIFKRVTLFLSLISLVAMMPVVAPVGAPVGTPAVASSQTSSSGFASHEGVLFQASTISALMEGVYDGMMAFGDLRKKGDFGIGTFDALDGEMVEVDGNIYQIRADGHAYLVNDTSTTPLAIVTFFKPEETLLLGGMLNLTQVQEEIDDELPSENVFYALKIEGRFSYVKARAPHMLRASLTRRWPRL
jgi:acetolactate decarboxylase